MSEPLKPWHIRHGKHARAYVQQPRSLVLRIVLYLRGWRHTHRTWWSKANERGMREK